MRTKRYFRDDCSMFVEAVAAGEAGRTTGMNGVRMSTSEGNLSSIEEISISDAVGKSSHWQL